MRESRAVGSGVRYSRHWYTCWWPMGYVEDEGAEEANMRSSETEHADWPLKILAKNASWVSTVTSVAKTVWPSLVRNSECALVARRYLLGMYNRHRD